MSTKANHYRVRAQNLLAAAIRDGVHLTITASRPPLEAAAIDFRVDTRPLLYPHPGVFSGKPDDEHVEAVIACLGDDAAMLREMRNEMSNVLPEVTDNMDAAAQELERLRALLNVPEMLNFLDGVNREAAHQGESWRSSHDGSKTPADWYWLVGNLAGKALGHAHELDHLQRSIPNPSPATEDILARHREKAVHHVITCAAALANWHTHMLGFTGMRPGSDPAKVAA
jgi:hypothetical protein